MNKMKPTIEAMISLKLVFLSHYVIQRNYVVNKSCRPTNISRLGPCCFHMQLLCYDLARPLLLANEC
jgi:hypothetical protein